MKREKCSKEKLFIFYFRRDKRIHAIRENMRDVKLLQIINCDI